MKVEIKHRFSGAILFALETESMRLCVEAAVQSRVSLDYASLVGARLDGASLDGASLDYGEKILANGVRMIGPIGSRSSYCAAYATDKGLRFREGCFFGDPDALRKKVVATHGATDHALDYEAWIAWCEAWYARMIRLPS